MGHNIECDHEDFTTDFPCNTLARTDYKPIKVDSSFGNDKDITGKLFKPAFAVSEGLVTKVLAIPVSVIEHATHIIATTGENKEKFDFFSQY